MLFYYFILLVKLFFFFLISFYFIYFQKKKGKVPLTACELGNPYSKLWVDERREIFGEVGLGRQK